MTTPAPAAAPVKSGWKTTEFYVTVFAIVGLVVSSLAASLSPKYAAIGASVSAAAYAISRGLAKLSKT
jgi:hypothetical protein